MASSIPPCNGDLRNMSGWDMSALLHVLDSEPGMVALQEEAGQAAVGVKAMDKIFRDFRHDLERFDALQFDVSLVLDLECLYQKFCGMKRQSHRLAVKAAAFARRDFGDVIVPLYNNPSVPIDECQEQLQGYVKKANLFQIEFVQIFSHVEEIKQEFESFTQNLRQWATKHEKTREEYLTRLKPQLAELQRLMDNDTSAGDGGSYSFDFAGAFQAAAVSLFAASVFALQGSNLVLPSLVGLLIHESCSLGFSKLTRREPEVNEEESALNEEFLQQKSYLRSIIDTRKELVRIGEAKAIPFSEATKVVQKMWGMARDDLMDLLSNDIDMQRGNLTNIYKLRAKSRIYEKMACYLRAYALELSLSS